MWLKSPILNSPPAILLRESYRLDGEVKSRTIANISHLPAHQIEVLRLALKGKLPSASAFASLPDSFLISRSRPHGHVAAVPGSLRKLKLDSILDPHPSRHRDLVIAMIVARILARSSTSNRRDAVLLKRLCDLAALRESGLQAR
jgi:hypothetical protein